MTGVDFTGELPAAEVHLLDERESIGIMEVELDVSGALLVEPMDCAELPLVEVTAANEHLLHTFRTTRLLLPWVSLYVRDFALERAGAIFHRISG